jgi:hypothetical protein
LQHHRWACSNNHGPCNLNAYDSGNQRENPDETYEERTRRQPKQSKMSKYEKGGDIIIALLEITLAVIKGVKKLRKLF